MISKCIGQGGRVAQYDDRYDPGYGVERVGGGCAYVPRRSTLPPATAENMAQLRKELCDALADSDRVADTE